MSVNDLMRWSIIQAGEPKGRGGGGSKESHSAKNLEGGKRRNFGN
jgi:hypothetical protein